jgi:hypothetical protein
LRMARAADLIVYDSHPKHTESHPKHTEFLFS